MIKHLGKPRTRREFLASALRTGALAGVGLGLSAGHAHGGKARDSLRAGEGVVDITPPVGIELAGFHRAAGNERRIKGIRQSMAVRAVVLQQRATKVAIVSVDNAGFSQETARRVQRQVERATGISPANVHVCSTHTHSAPAFCYLRQWGAIPTDYMAEVEKKTVEAVRIAQDDLVPAVLSVGKSRAVGGNHNRTNKTFKTDEQFTKDSTHDERWLDTTLRVMVLERSGGKRDLMWYHFSAHPVCFADELAGPDWPGMVAQLVQESHQLAPSFLQGHAGDVRAVRGEATRRRPQRQFMPPSRGRWTASNASRLMRCGRRRGSLTCHGIWPCSKTGSSNIGKILQSARVASG